MMLYSCKARQKSLESATAAPARPGPPGPPGRPAPAPAEGAAGPGSGSASPDAAGAQHIITDAGWLIFHLNNSIVSIFCNQTWTCFFFFRVKHDTRHINIDAQSKDFQIHKMIIFLDY
jgi:hypothetical protein